MSHTFQVQTIGVIGAGTMGSGIALMALRADFRVVLYDVAPEMLERGRQYIEQQLSRKGNVAALERLTLSTALTDLVGAEVVIEAAVENLAIKQELFIWLDSICPPPAILATNTSTLSITAIASITTSPERVGGMHFFNPAPVLPLVEVGRGGQTSQETVERLVTLAERFGKTPVVTRDTPGFIVNRVARPFYNESLRLAGEGSATYEQIDQITQLGGGFRMGPFRLMDLIGIDINYTSTRSVYEQTYSEPRYRPHWLQEQMVQQKTLGKKSGRGFYDYTGEATPSVVPSPPPLQPQTGSVNISPGDWGPGLIDLCQQAGYNLGSGAEPVAGLVVAGRPDLAEQALSYDRVLPSHRPLFCQAVDTTVHEIATWLSQPQRLVGFDSLFVGSGQVATLVASPVLSDKVRQAAEQFFTGLGRRVIWIEDTPALVLPRIVALLANEAAFAVGEGVADRETVDRAMQLGGNYPRGPLAWAEALGYNHIVTILDHLRAEYGEERYRAAPLLRRLARLTQLQQ
jgi:3-hydroxybutyryl-CoA dehydrogenase